MARVSFLPDARPLWPGLTRRLPFVGDTGLASWSERLRDAVLGHAPVLDRRLQRQRRANELFIRSVLDTLGATVFLDNSQDPFRLRQLTAAVGLVSLLKPKSRN